MMIVRILADLLVACGLTFALAGSLGLLKMPDFFSRMQASTCITTLGILCTALGGILYAACFLRSFSACVKIGVIAMLVLATNPIGAHVLARGAYLHGIRPETPLDPDELGREADE